MVMFFSVGRIRGLRIAVHPENDVARISYVETLARNVYHLDIFGWSIARGDFLFS